MGLLRTCHLDFVTALADPPGLRAWSQIIPNLCMMFGQFLGHWWHKIFSAFIELLAPSAPISAKVTGDSSKQHPCCLDKGVAWARGGGVHYLPPRIWNLLYLRETDGKNTATSFHVPRTMHA